MKNLKKIVTLVTITLLMLGSFNGMAQSNKNNPYDYIGQIHNEVLTEFILNHKTAKSDTKTDYLKMIELVNNNKTAKRNGVREKYDESTVELLNNGMYHFKNGFKDLTNGMKVSENTKKELLSLMNYILITTPKEKIGQSDFNNYLIAKESEILKNKKYSLNDKKILLGSFSTARYSYDFWNKRISANKNSSKRGFWGVVAVIGGDVAGFFGGGMSGATTASHLVGEAVDSK